MSEEKATFLVTWLLDHWVAVLIGVAAVVVTAFVVAAVTEWYKAHRNKQQEDKIEGWVIQKVLAFTAILFGGLEYALPFVQQNIAVLGSLKYVGGFVIAVYAAANYLYSWKFKKVFKAVTGYLEQRRAKLEAKQALKASGVQTVQPQPLEQPISPEHDSPFEAVA